MVIGESLVRPFFRLSVEIAMLRVYGPRFVLWVGPPFGTFVIGRMLYFAYEAMPW